ncbi:MAG: hypothetical protein QOD38_864 [Acidimicrobiaceae bacterium]
MKPVTGLLVWSLMLIAIDGALIARDHDAGHQPVAQPRTSSTIAVPSTATSAVAPTDAGESAATTSDPAASIPTTTEDAPTADAPTSTASSAETVVAHLQGDGDTPSSAPFHVEGRWELRWRVDQGGGVAASIDDDHGQRLFMGLKPGEGSTIVTTGCNCTLRLTPDGSAYDVVVVDVEG